MIILGLDLGSTTGWAVADDNGITASGTWYIAPRRGESPGCRYLHLRSYLYEVLRAFDAFDLVVYEAAHHRGGAATEYAVGCVTTVQAWCAQRTIEHASVHTATLKKFATGSGKADKEKMLTAARWMAGRAVSDDNEADAIHAALYGLGQVLGAHDLYRSRHGAGEMAGRITGEPPNKSRDQSRR